MNAKVRTVTPVSLLALVSAVFAQTDCSPRPGGGYSCYDYQRGTFTDITPRPGGGHSAYDYGTGRHGTIRPRPGGGFNIESD